jgi:hypothetical protein
VLQDVSVFDLRFWKPGPAGDTLTRTSPVNYSDYLRLTKTRDTDRFVGHYSTSGSAIDFRCITHACHVVRCIAAACIEHPGERQYALVADVSKEIPGQEFLLLIEATYWNGFPTSSTESAQTYTDRDVDRLTDLRLDVVLPDEKPFTGFDLFSSETGSAAEQRYERSQDLVADPSRHVLQWRISDLRPHHHYRLAWHW